MWKHFGILLFGLVAVSNALATPPVHPIVLSAEAKEKILQRISQRVVNEVTRSGIRPSSSILAFADPASLDDAVINLPNELGVISAWDSSASGASQITTFFDISVGFPKAGASFMLSIPSLRLAGQHEAVIRLHRFLKITSHEDYSVELTNGRVDAEVQLRISIDGYIDVEAVSLHISFEALKIATGGTYLNKEPIDIEALTGYLPTLWASVWPDFKQTVDTKVQEIANELLAPCNVFTLIGGDYSCLEIGSPLPPPALPDQSYFIYSDNITTYGTWANDADRCPDGLFVTGFQLKTEEKQWGADDTALNAVRFYCGNTEQSTLSTEGKWGEWGRRYDCSPGQYANGFQLRSEEERALTADNTAANNIRIFCTGNTNYIEGDGLGYGDWRSQFMCKPGFAICGHKTQVQPDQSAVNDDTALNNIAALCCPFP